VSCRLPDHWARGAKQDDNQHTLIDVTSQARAASGIKKKNSRAAGVPEASAQVG
jgi:hypothetical protein